MKRESEPALLGIVPMVSGVSMGRAPHRGARGPPAPGTHDSLKSQGQAARTCPAMLERDCVRKIPEAEEDDAARGEDGDFFELLQRLAEAHELAVAKAQREACDEHCTGQAQRLPVGPVVLTKPQPPAASPPLPGCYETNARASSKHSINHALSRTSSASEVVKASKSFRLLRVWSEDPISEAQNPHRYNFSFTPKEKVKCGAPTSHTRENLIMGSSCFQPLLLHPGSFKRLSWDLLSVLFLFYDMIMIPFAFAFDPPAVAFTIVMNYTTLCYWSLDMVVSMLTGYQEGRDTVVEFGRILRRYLRTWFVLDACIVSLDWALLCLGELDPGRSSPARLGRSLRTLRFVRSLRLIRLFKVKRILLEIQDQINTEAISICFRIIKIVLVLILANHVVACAWYAIGSCRTGSDGLSSWVVENQVADRPLAYQYVTSLHWSLTQFTPASMEVVPENTRERLFAVVVLLFAMITFSSFVSVLTASMSELRNIGSDEARQFWLLRRYLRDWQVSRRLALRLQRYLEYTYHEQRQRVQAKDVKLLSLLSGPLHDELKAHTMSSHLVWHPLFLNSSRCLRVFSRSLSDIHLCGGDYIFYYGERASSMLFVCAGVFNYQLGQLVAGTGSSFRPQRVRQGQWVAEAVLWTHWLHLGDLQALTEGQVISVDAHVFGEAVLVYRPSWLAFREYAQRFVEAMNGVDQKDLTDLLHQQIQPQDILDSSAFGKNHSIHDDDNQEPSLVKIGQALCNRVFERCAWCLFGSSEDAVEQRNAFASEEADGTLSLDSMK